MSDNSIQIGHADATELAELLQFINDWLPAEQNACISAGLLCRPNPYALSSTASPPVILTPLNPNRPHPMPDC
ncbi:hypothetical protein ACIBG0_41740 [Nocardia sp. NPDC050630]|uniref:hypothetical protein n=1 Tax=Nocardia sp. NPDC050630 TaxID=3364321 RepID=UPI003798B29C